MICWHCGENPADYWRPYDKEEPCNNYMCKDCAEQFDIWKEEWELRDVDIDNAFTGHIGE